MVAILTKSEVIKMAREANKQIRTVQAKFTAREEGEGQDLYIEGRWIPFGQETELWPGAFEEIAPTACDETLGNDIRALTNHNSTLVLGRNKAGTLKLEIRSDGLWGSVKINREDSDAMNTYARVKRGDVDQCSFGFEILEETTDWRDDGTVKWTITKMRLHEVSVCTFPAYEETGVQARKAEVEQHRERLLEAKRTKLKERLDECLNS